MPAPMFGIAQNDAVPAILRRLHLTIRLRRYTYGFAGSTTSHSGIYHDLVVRKRKTEVDGLRGPLTTRVTELIHSIERGAAHSARSPVGCTS